MTRSRSCLPWRRLRWEGSDEAGHARVPTRCSRTKRTPHRRSADIWAGGGIKAVIPLKDDQRASRAKKGSTGGRPPTFDVDRYRDRNTVERAVNKLRGHRAVATRFDKRDYVYRGTLTVAAIVIWLRDPVENPLRDTP